MRLFISYSHQDTAFVNQLSSALEQQGFEVWIDRSSIQGGEAWRKSIVQGIGDSDAFIVVLSPNSTTSRNVVKEISIAEDKHKRVFPVICQPCTIPEDMEYQLTGLQYIDLSGANYAGGFTKLIDALNEVTDAPSPARPPMPAPQPVPQPFPTQPQTAFSPVGIWQVQFMHPLTGVVIGYGQFTIAAAGDFTGGLNTVQGAIQVQGKWQLLGPQLTLQGGYAFTTMPYNILPYMLIVQIMNAAPAQFNGMAASGEQVVFQRVG